MPGAGVDLIVDRVENADGELFRIGSVVGGHRRLRALAQPLHELAQILFRQGEDDRDRIDLRDDDDAVRIGGRDVIADIDLPQPDTAVERAKRRDNRRD